MKKRRLGKNGPIVSAMGLGCMGMSDYYGSPDERNDQESIATIHRALDLGVTLINTADGYGLGRNEELVGKAIRGRRDQVTLTTKCSSVRDKNGKVLGPNGTPQYVKAACEASLRRLGVDVIDLYHQGRVDPNTTIEETVGAMAELVREGKICYIGLSEAGPKSLRRACAVHPITALETEYSLWTRDVEETILPTCRELGIGFVAYGPLGQGFLTAAIQSASELPPGDVRRMIPRFEPENFSRNLELLRRLQQIASDKGCTPAQLALLWVLAQGEDIVPIPGTKRQTRLEENLGALDLELTPNELVRLNQAMPPGAASGFRVPEWSRSWVMSP